MKMVKSLLLGSAAGLVAVAGAQAADLPVKAKPVLYVKICDLYGAGFYYIPGTDTCIKLGGYLRIQAAVHMDGGGVANGFLGMATHARYNRSETNDINYRIRAVLSADVRSQTAYGTLRSYYAIGVEATTPGVSGSLTTNAPAYWDRAFIQFAGFTIGKAQSFYDTVTYGGAYSYHNVRTTSDTGATGIALWAYTQQLGNGMTATISVEDPTRRNHCAVDATAGGFFANPGVTCDNGLTAQSATLNGFLVPDIIFNWTVSQAWGRAAASFALHQVSAAYNGTPNALANGHPDNEWGWGASVGILLNVPGAPAGSVFGANFQYSEGAAGFAAGSGATTLSIWDSSTSWGGGWIVDGVFDSCPSASVNNATGAPLCTGGRRGTSIELTTVWSAIAFYQHVWNPQWRSTVYGGYVDIDYGGTATGIINSHFPGAQGSRQVCGFVGGAVIGVITPGRGNSCNPDFSYWQAGHRTQWTPVPNLDIGVDIVYSHINTAYSGAGTVGAAGLRPSIFGTSVIDDQNVWSVIARWQRSFYP
jgi:hypothetical protein